ncbi:MAG: ECF transporter S component [Clostridiales bacterium]|nr:ECF transporter S component [Clostridiales bacterium]
MNNVKKLTLTAMFMALGLVLPFLTGQIPQIGSMLLPMHIPVFFCALICGWQWATPMALMLPVLRSLLFGMPPMYPGAIAMAFEFAAYAFAAGFIYACVKKQNLLTLYISIIAAMICGRVVWGIAQVILLGLNGKPFTFAAFLAGAVTNAIPGIILQLILIPLVMLALDRAKLVKFKK